MLGDIHANLPALAACWEQAEAEGYDRIAHTGDVVGYGPFPNECVAFLRERNIPGARGNFDENVGADADESGSRDPSPEEKVLAEASFRWTRRQIQLMPKRWLADLPFEVRMEDGRGGLVVYHASPFDLRSSLGPGMPESLFREYGREAGAGIVITGHCREPFHRRVGRMSFVNAGSVGRPRDGDPRTGYAVIEVMETNGEVKVAFRRFSYDIEAVIRTLGRRGAPADLAPRLQKGL